MNTLRVCVVALALSVVAVAVAATPSYGLGIEFEKIFDIQDPAITAAGTYTGFNEPHIEGRSAAFRGAGPGFVGVFQWANESVSLVADLNTSVPGQTGPVSAYSGFTPVTHNGSFYFTGYGPEGSGIYVKQSGTLSVVADYTTPVPDGSGTFQGFNSLNVKNGIVSFVGRDSGGHQGIYTVNEGTVETVVNGDTAVPGLPGVTNIGGMSFDGEDFAFTASNDGTTSMMGVYKIIDDIISVVADHTTPIPDGSGDFTRFFQPRIDQENVAFKGVRDGTQYQSGIYAELSGSLVRVADRNTPIPEGTGDFQQFYGMDIEHGRVVFNSISEVDKDDSGIYFFENGTLRKVIDTGDQLDGRNIREPSGGIPGIGFSAPGLDGDLLAFSVQFDSGDPGRAAYLATIPEPSTLILAAIGLFGLLFTRRRR